jgi:hypothetical protein
MTDDFIRELRSQWLAQPVDKAAVVGRLRRGRWTPRLLFWLEVVQGVAGAVFGVAFLWLAIDVGLLERLVAWRFAARGVTPEGLASLLLGVRIMFAFSGLVMLLAVPPLAWAAVSARRRSLRWEDETPESVLRVGLRRADASLRANRIGRWHVWVLLAFVAGLWALPVLGLLPVFLMVFMTLIYLGVIAPIWIWLDLRREAIRRELETCLKLVEDYQGDSVV